MPLKKTFAIVLALAAMLSVTGRTQDGGASLDATARALGATNLNTLEFSGWGYDYVFGQTYNGSSAWPRFSLPPEKILIEADSFSPPAAPLSVPPNGFANLVHFSEAVERLRLDVEQVIPIHGPVGSLDVAREMIERFGTVGTD